MSLINFWIARLGRLMQRIVGITFDLTDLTFDDADLDLDLTHGRE